MAGLRIRGEPPAEVGNARPGSAGRVALERLVGDQIPQWRQTVRRRWRESLHRRSFLLADGRKTSLANLPYRIHVRFWPDGPDRPGPAPDRLLVARLDGVAKRHARWREPTEPEIAAAATELREVAGNRADLLAEVAGTVLGAREGRLDEPRARAAAQVCIAAGADESIIPQWIQEGRRRTELRRNRPFSQPARTPPRP